MLNKWNKRKLSALIWSIPWLVFPNLASPTGRNTQGEQSIPGILVLCFRGQLAFSKPEVQDCWQKPKLWDSDFFFFFSWLQRLQHQLSSQSCECSGLTARAQPWWSSGKSAEALPGFQFQAFHSKIIYFPLFFSPLSICHITSILPRCTVIVIQGKKPRIFMLLLCILNYNLWHLP